MPSNERNPLDTTRSTRQRVFRTVLIAASVVASSMMAGCVTGPRPTLGPTTSVTPVTDPAIVAVIDSLSSTATAPFSVTYDVTTKYGGLTSSAEVAFDPTKGTAILIDNVLFVYPVNDSSVTCTWSEESLSITDCSSGIDETRVSHLQLNSRVFQSAAADRLNRDAQISAGAAQARTIQLADHPAVCADVPVIDGNGAQQTKSYCAFSDLGVIASLDTADLTINAVFVDDIVTSTLFDIPAAEE